MNDALRTGLIERGRYFLYHRTVAARYPYNGYGALIYQSSYCGEENPATRFDERGRLPETRW